MPGKSKRTSSGSRGKKTPQKRSGPAAITPGDVDPRMCGLRDAVRRGWYRVETGEVFPGFQVTADDIVLDVGCGEGNAVLFCARQGAHVVFSDVDPVKVAALIQLAHASPARKVEGFVSDSLPLPLPDGYATKILSTEMLEHTSCPEKILEELVRVGRPGAGYLITVPDARSEALQKPVAQPGYFSEPNHIQIFDRQRFVRLVEASGLRVESYDTWGFFWTVFMALFWVAKRSEGVDGAVLDSIKPP
ncbi:MAG: class I SAM-dependent methyltransferase, partial [Deltaproteobacteria bacterium]|nr:class I SAM-dependent methyltransferase [Deltaproteobacteria bacterium]